MSCPRTNDAAVADVVALALKHFSRIDGLVLNAATLEPLCRIGDDTPIEQWKTHFDVNFFSLITALKVTLPALRKSQLGGMSIDSSRSGLHFRRTCRVREFWRCGQGNRGLGALQREQGCHELPLPVRIPSAAYHGA